MGEVQKTRAILLAVDADAKRFQFQILRFPELSSLMMLPLMALSAPSFAASQFMGHHITPIADFSGNASTSSLVNVNANKVGLATQFLPPATIAAAATASPFIRPIGTLGSGSSSGLIINITYDASVSSAPAAFKTLVAQVVQDFENKFSAPVTVTINVGWGTIGGSPLSGGAIGESSYFLDSFSYSQMRNAMIAKAQSADASMAMGTLPASDPTGGGSFYMSQAEAKALGLVSGTGIDGWTGFAKGNMWCFDHSTGVPAGQYDLYGTVAHEISEVLGRELLIGQSFGAGPVYSPLDLFDYSASSVRKSSAPPPGYFSINGGTTILDHFNTNPGGDYGDWAGSAGADAFLAFASGGVIMPVTEPDIKLLDVIGWQRVSVSSPVITSALTAAGTVGSAFSYQITATNSPTSFNATGLPAGLSVNTSTGRIFGTPTVPGSFNINLSAANSNGTGTAILGLTLVDATPPAVAITAPSNGATVAGTVNVTGTSSDNVLVSSVAISVDGGTYSIATGTANWSFNLNTLSLANGAHTFQAEAWDTSSNTSTSTVVNVTVNNPIVNGCSVPSGSYNHTYYVDPVNGSMSNNGSEAAPWHTLAEVVNNGLVSTQMYTVPYSTGSALVPHNPTGVVHAGDLIYLLSGNHGDVLIQGAVNTDFITVSALPGQTPVLNTLTTEGASKWVFQGLTIQTLTNNLVNFFNHNFWGPTDNVILSGSTLQSQADVSAWIQADWVAKGSNQAVRDEATCATITNNQIRNVKFGIGISAPNALVQGNTIDNFGDDGIDISASSVTVRRNQITNNLDIGDGNHNDGVQGFPPGGSVGTVYNTVIDGNTVIAATHPLPWPGGFQGISVFDGVWIGYQVSNNVVVTTAYHGIAAYGVINANIINNTVLAQNPTQSTWILVTNEKAAEGGTPSSNVIVRNNLATLYLLGDGGVEEDHNQVVSSTPAASSVLPAGDTTVLPVSLPEAVFVKFNNTTLQYDLHLSPSSHAIGAGGNETSLGIASLDSDIAGIPRPASGAWDAGAYKYTGPLGPPVITSGLNAAGNIGATFSYQITATNNPTSYNATGLPGGLSVNTNNGLISGTPVSSGTFSVALSAVNSSGTGNATLTLTINAPDTIPPTVAVTAPSNGATISGTINILGTSSDNIAVSSVAVAIDAGAYALAVGTTNWHFSLNATGLANGAHTLQAKAWDTSGNASTSTVVNVIVNNTAPTASSTPGLKAAIVYPNPVIPPYEPVIRVCPGIVDSLDVTIFDIAGRVVNSSTQFSGPSIPAAGAGGGEYCYEYTWTGRIPSGVYFAVVHAHGSGALVKARMKFAVVR